MSQRRIVGSLRIWVLVTLLLSCVDGARAFAADRVFVHNLPSHPASLDPAKSNNIHDDQVMWFLYDALTQLSADSTQMFPALAERWERSADGLTYTFTLRKNVYFHDGSLLDADAVKASYERQFLRSSPFYTSTPPNAYERVLSGFIKEIRVLDAHTVAITTHYPRPAQFALVMIVSPKALQVPQHRGDLSRAPSGTGPFRLHQWEDNQLVLTPFPDSWQGRPKLDSLRFVVTTTEVEAVDRIISGDFDLFLPVGPDYFELLRSKPHVDLKQFGGLNTMFFGMQLDRAKLKDRRVREAIVRAVNRDRLATVLGRGAMIPAKSPLPPGCAGFDPAVSQPNYDPERARALLREAGVGSGLTLRLLYFSPIELWSEIVVAIKSDLEKVGVGLDLIRTESWNDFYAQRKKDAHDLYFYNWSIATPDPERLLSPLFHSQSQDNFGHYVSPRVDKLLTEARQPMDEVRRLQLYSEASRLIVEDIPGLFLVHRIGVAAVSARAKGLALNLYGHPQDKLVTMDFR